MFYGKSSDVGRYLHFAKTVEKVLQAKLLRYKEVRVANDNSWVDNGDDEVIAGFDKGAWFLEETQQQRGALTQILVEIE